MCDQDNESTGYVEPRQFAPWMHQQPHHLPSEALRLDDLPPANADWPTLAAFALTFDGYEHWGSFERCANFANSPRTAGEGLDVLRTRLFFEQRRWRHFMRDPDGECMMYLHGIVEDIRTLIKNRNSDEARQPPGGE